MKPTILGIASSLRSKTKSINIKKICHGIHSDMEFLMLFEKYTRDKLLSNSDACLLAAMYGAHKDGCEIVILSPDSNFDYDCKIVEECDGVVLSTPVYFGDMASPAKRFFEICHAEGFLKNKLFSVCSVGAKRNGGQETCNIFSLFNALSMKGIIIGNGPKTSQYGGTGWAGDIGAIREDNFGIETSMATGENIARSARLLRDYDYHIPDCTLNIVILSADPLPDDHYLWTHKDEIAALLGCKIRLETVVLKDYQIKRCHACSICPSRKVGDYKCMVKDDDFRKIHKKLMKADLIIKRNDFGSEFDIFMERTRYLRRDHFRLTFVPFFTMFDTRTENVSFKVLRDLTNFIRHNTLIMPRISMDSRRLATHKIQPNEQLMVNLQKALLVKKNKLINGNYSFSYIPVGYKGG